MQISATMVKDLRERTGAGMMDCKAALQETSGDFEAAIDWLRKKGISKAEKKSGRVAAEGMVVATSKGTKGAVVEVNAETDFVAKNDLFVAFANEVNQLVIDNGETAVEKISAMTLPSSGKTVAEQLTTLIATIGENMSLRRAASLSVKSGVVSSYVHMNGKIGVLVAIEAPEASDKLAETAKNIAMHVAAANPKFLDRTSVDNSALEREKAIFMEQARASGKPEAIIGKIVEGRVSKFYEEVCLVDQAFIMDTDRKVGDIVRDVHPQAKIAGFVRYALGEGIEKESGDFAAEVAAMAK
ncbi:MAG: elongation factor Ts [Proteobacteria bacterium]|nr:elongation factor Ts [Pseudomonadota bacterium]